MKKLLSLPLFLLSFNSFAFSYSQVTCDQLKLTIPDKEVSIKFSIPDGRINNENFQFAFEGESSLSNLIFKLENKKLTGEKIKAYDHGRILNITRNYDVTFYLKSDELSEGKVATVNCTEELETYYN
ncbi:MAG: hypothetical protein HQK53_07175 [Oligoflexia bacterium]|nr:hypothetical protein [Oligoflexia bacterium]